MRLFLVFRFFSSLSAVIFLVIFGGAGVVQCQDKFSLDIIEQNDLVEETSTLRDYKSTTISTTLSGTSFSKTSSSERTTAPLERTTPKPSKTVKKYQDLVCPGKDVRRPFFPWPCQDTRDCSFLGQQQGMLCCSRRCLKGVPPPKPEPVHEPTFFGLIDRTCPTEHIAEFFEVTECNSDSDCTPRICCPEKLLDGQTVGFCRTAQPKLDRLPGAQRFLQPLKTLMGYMQCTPPPPPVLDVFPKPCNNQLDCFPNLCCQERGKKFCRPPKRSILSLVTTVAQRFVPENAARNFLSRIT